jgi:hypothetical protein
VELFVERSPANAEFQCGTQAVVAMLAKDVHDESGFRFSSCVAEG